MDEIYEHYLTKYIQHFGEGFPTIPLAWSNTKEEVISIIETCIKENKNVYELGYLEDEDDVLY